MILRSGTVLSRMARSKTSSSRTSSSDEENNKGERPLVVAQSLEPVLIPVPAIGQVVATQAPSSVSMMAMSTMPMYWMPPSFVPPTATQAPVQPGLRSITTTFQNPLYTNTIMANLPPFGSFLGLLVGPNIGNPIVGPMYPNMTRSMPFSSLLY